MNKSNAYEPLSFPSSSESVASMTLPVVLTTPLVALIVALAAVSTTLTTVQEDRLKHSSITNTLLTFKQVISKQVIFKHAILKQATFKQAIFNMNIL